MRGMDASPRLHWQALRFAELNATTLYALLRLRAEVFVVEQACAYLDPDGRDAHPQALHLLGRADDGVLAAYLRLLPPTCACCRPDWRTRRRASAGC